MRKVQGLNNYRKGSMLTFTHHVEVVILSAERLGESDNIIDFQLKIKAKLDRVGRHRPSNYTINFLCSHNPGTSIIATNAGDRLEIFSISESFEIVGKALTEYKEEIVEMIREVKNVKNRRTGSHARKG